MSLVRDEPLRAAPHAVALPAWRHLSLKRAQESPRGAVYP
jgi:hypothetical protein